MEALLIKKREKEKVWKLQEDMVLLIVSVAVFVLFSITAKGFFTVNNFFTIIRAMSIITVLGVGVTFVITTGEMDLSIGTVPALCGSVFAVMVEKGLPHIAALFIALIAAIAIGLLNGLIITNTNLPSIIITLASSMIASGLAYIITNQHAIVIGNNGLIGLFSGNLGKFPVIVIWMLIAVLVGFLLLHFLKFGRNIAFIGDNRTAAKFTGIQVGGIITITFLICAVYSFVAGMLGVAQAGNARPEMLTENMMPAIAATLLGGTSLAGGRGNVLGTIVGAFFLTLIQNGFLIFGVAQWILYLINGIVIILSLTWKYLGNR